MKNPKIYKQAWKRLFETHERRLSATSGGWDVESQAACQALGEYKLHCFAERLIYEYASPWRDLTQDEAISLYLINQHHWTLEQARVLKPEDQLLVLHRELLELKLDRTEGTPVLQWLGLEVPPGDLAAHFEAP